MPVRFYTRAVEREMKAAERNQAALNQPPKPEPRPLPPLTVPLREGWSIQRNGKYLKVVNVSDHPLADRKGGMPYHRFVLYEKLKSPAGAACAWCGYLLPWKLDLSMSNLHVINADHLDGNPENNSPENLVPACWWCNINRSWAESYPDFWYKWIRWMASVPPAVRPNLVEIALDFGIEAFPKNEPDSTN